MENKFITLLREKQPSYNIRVDDFKHPSDKNGEYVTLYINELPTKIILEKSEYNSENENTITELVNIFIDHVEKYNVTNHE